jgi:hypothetical protein
MKSFTILARPSCRPPSGFASALVLMTVATGFTKVELSGTGELPIETTGTESLTISAEDNILPRLTSKVSGDTLILGTKPTTIVTTKPITFLDREGPHGSRAVGVRQHPRTQSHDYYPQHQDQRLRNDHCEWHRQ